MASIEVRKTDAGETRYRARWRDPSGSSREKWFKKRRDAASFLALIQVEMGRGTYIDPRAGDVSVAIWVESWMAHRPHLRETTRIRDDIYMTNYVIPAFGGFKLSAVRRSHLRSWVSSLTARGLSPSTISKAIQLFSSALTAATDDGLIATNPARGVSSPPVRKREMRFLTASQVFELANAVGDAYRALVLLGAFTGLRPGELLGLRWEDFDALRRVVKVQRTMVQVRGQIRFHEPKTSASLRTVTMPQFIVQEMALHMSRKEVRQGGLIFTGTEGGPLYKDNFRRRVWIPAVRSSVGEPFRLHDLRHTAAALMIEQRLHAKLIQERLGHRSISTTLDRYGHILPGIADEAADILDRAYRPEVVGVPWGAETTAIAPPPA